MEDKRIHHGAVDKHTSEQQSCKSDVIRKPGAIDLVKSVLMEAGWLANWQMKYR